MRFCHILAVTHIGKGGGADQLVVRLYLLLIGSDTFLWVRGDGGHFHCLIDAADHRIRVGIGQDHVRKGGMTVDRPPCIVHPEVIPGHRFRGAASEQQQQ